MNTRDIILLAEYLLHRERDTSPFTSYAEAVKVADSLAAGATLVWVVDPERRSVAVYRSLLDRRRLEEGDSLDGGEVLPGLTIPLADLFRP